MAETVRLYIHHFGEKRALRIHVNVTPHMTEALEKYRTPFALEWRRLELVRSMPYDLILIDSSEVLSLARSLEAILPRLNPRTRRAAEKRIQELQRAQEEIPEIQRELFQVS